jgi:hypothetical protein
MNIGYEAEFSGMVAELDSLPADLRAVARVMAVVVEANPYRWPSVQGAGGEQVLEARFGCGRMRFTVTEGVVDIQGFGWIPDGHG